MYRYEGKRITNMQASVKSHKSKNHHILGSSFSLRNCGPAPILLAARPWPIFFGHMSSWRTAKAWSSFMRCLASMQEIYGWPGAHSCDLLGLSWAVSKAQAELPSTHWSCWSKSHCRDTFQECDFQSHCLPKTGVHQHRCRVLLGVLGFWSLEKDSETHEIQFLRPPTISDSRHTTSSCRGMVSACQVSSVYHLTRRWFWWIRRWCSCRFGLMPRKKVVILCVENSG